MVKIPIIKPNVFSKDLLNRFETILKSGQLTKGPYLKKFELKLAEKLHIDYALGTSSGTTALHLALLSLNIGHGDEVLVSDYSFPASANVVVHVGARPVLIDINLENFCIDIKDLEKKITKKSKAIMVVHAFGYPANMSEIMKIAKKHHLFVIEDAACALGSVHKGKMCGSWGDIGCFSFHPRKVITTGEGGAIVTNKSELTKKAEIWRDHGMVIKNKKIDFFVSGYNCRLSELQAALGVDQLKKLEKINHRRLILARKYISKLQQIPGLTLPKEPKNGFFNFQSFVVLLPKKINREKLMRYLKEKGIETAIGTYAIHALSAFKKFGYKSGDLPNSFLAYKQTLTLPLYDGLSEKNMDHIALNLEKAIKNDTN